MLIEAIHPGDKLLVASGEAVPTDGVVTSGAAVLDEAALTSEPLRGSVAMTRSRPCSLPTGSSSNLAACCAAW